MSKGNPKGTQGRVSPNRKYVQLGLGDIEQLRLLTSVYCNDDEPLSIAVKELTERARATPNARICLAHAVVRVSK